MKDFVKKHKFLCIALIVSILIFIPIIIFNDSIYIFSGDFLEQLVPIYIQAWNRLRSGSLPFWDWTNFLGANYYGANLYYCFGSPFFWISMLVPKAELIPYTFIYLYILKVVLCIIFTYMWLYKVYKNDLGASIGGLIVTFSGFVLANVADGFLFDGVVFCPLILYFIECFLQDKKTLGLSLSIALVGIVDYYILYIFISFVCLYTLMRYLVINDKPTFKKTLKDGLHFMFRVLLGILVACFVLIPAVYALNNTPKADELVLSLQTVGKRNIYRFITSFFTPTSDWRQNYNFFISTDLDYVGVSHCGGYSNYSLIISIFCLIPLLFIKNKKEKIGVFSLLGLYSFLSCFKMFYILLNQNYATRWMLIYPFLFAYIVLLVINYKNEINKKYFLISSVICIVLLAFFTIFSIKIGFTFWEWEINALKRNAYFLSLILLLFGLSFSFANDKYKKYIILLLVFADIGLSYVNLYTNIEENKPLTEKEFNTIFYAEKDAPAYIKSIDDSFYRIDQSVSTPSNLNSNLAVGYKSFIGYHSLLNYNGLDFMNGRFTLDGHCVIKPQKGKDLLKTMLGSKYWYIYNPVKFDNGTIEYESDPPYGYSYLTSNGEADIYINDYPITFAYFRDKVISKDDFDSFDTLHQDYLLLDHLVLDRVESKDTKNMVNIKCLKNKDDDSKYYSLENSNGIIYISGENNIGTNFSFVDNESNNLTYGYLNYIDYYGITIPLNTSFFNDLKPEGHEIYYDDMSWYDDWYNSQVMVDPDSVVWDDNSISGTITTEKDGYIVTSVPYDSGWTVKLDGKKIDYLKVNEGFVGFTITPGSHTIEMNYVPPGLILGSIVSVSSLVLCLILNYLNKKDKIKVC